jgi:ABC-type amino acid transport substrate-binding protein
MITNRLVPWLVAALALHCQVGSGASEPARAARPPEPAPALVLVQAAPAMAPSTPLVLRVGTSGDYAPFSTKNPSGTPSGFDVELAESLAQGLGAELRWVAFRWPELSRQVEAGELDVAMGGVSWQPARAVLGYMTRAVARGGPCVLGDAAAPRVAVNRGGVLESWARAHLAEREIITVEDNLSLPRLLSSQEVGAIVTDSFELRSFERPGWAVRCEPARTRKVYWVAPGAGAELGPRIDAWLSENTALVHAAARRWFGEEQRLDATTHLVDLLARRLEFMPLVGAIKAQRNLPIEDLPREREVVASTAAAAARLGLPAQPVADLFALQIELSKALQRRQKLPSSLDLARQIRPALDQLGERILGALAQARIDGGLERLTLADLELLSPWLGTEERRLLLERLRAIRPSSSGG